MEFSWFQQAVPIENKKAENVDKTECIAWGY